MKQSKLLLGLIGICLLFGFSSCEGEDKSVFGDDFEIPELMRILFSLRSMLLVNGKRYK